MQQQPSELPANVTQPAGTIAEQTLAGSCLPFPGGTVMMPGPGVNSIVHKLSSLTVESLGSKWMVAIFVPKYTETVLNRLTKSFPCHMMNKAVQQLHRDGFNQNSQLSDSDLELVKKAIGSNSSWALCVWTVKDNELHYTSYSREFPAARKGVMVELLENDLTREIINLEIARGNELAAKEQADQKPVDQEQSEQVEIENGPEPGPEQLQ